MLAIVRGLRKAGAIDDEGLRTIAGELQIAATKASQYGSSEALVIESLADDIQRSSY